MLKTLRISSIEFVFQKKRNKIVILFKRKDFDNMIVHIEFKDNNGFWKSIKTYKFKYSGKKKPKLGWYFFPYYKSFIKIVKVEDKNYSFKNAKYVKLFFRILLIDKEA